MGEQYGRRWSLTASTLSKALDLSQLRIRFKIKQWDLQTPNNAVIRLTNAAPDTIKALQDEFTRVTLQVGYGGGQLGTIFDGNIIQVFDGRESQVDTMATIVAGDGDEAVNFSVTNQTLAAGSTLTEQFQAVIANFNGYGVKQGYIGALPANPLPRGKAAVGMTKDVMRRLAQQAGANWSIQNGRVNVMPITGYLPGEAVVLNSDTGMIGFPQQTQDGITVRCLINPKITVGGRVQIANQDIIKAQVSPAYTALNFLPRVADDGFYRVIVQDLIGDTRGNDWYADLICIALDDAVTPGLAAKGYG